MPIYTLKCKRCNKDRELILTEYARLDEVIKILPCDYCGKVGWKKVPTTATIRFKGDGWG